MAETIVNEVYGEDFHACSAGLCTSEEKPMCYDARAALVRAGYDEKPLLRKISRRVDDEMMKKADIIVGVTEAHAAALRDKYPAYAGKITTFPLAVNAPSADDAEGYDRCFKNLCDGIEKLLYPGGADKWKSKSE